MSNKLAKFLATHKVFTHQDFHQFWRKNFSSNAGTIENSLKYHINKGRIKRLKRGVYATLSPLDTKEKYYVNPYVVAAKLTPDAVLAYHTAIEFYGKAYTSYSTIYYLTQTHSRNLKLGQTEYHPLSHPSILLKKSKINHLNYEIIEEEYEGIKIKITSLERTLVDMLNKLSLSGGWEEVWRSFESTRLLNWERVIDYCLLLENATLVAKLGFYLEERIKDGLTMEPAYMRVLEKKIPKQAHYLERVARQDKSEEWCFVKRWNLMVPKGVLNKNWEEVSEE